VIELPTIACPPAPPADAERLLLDAVRLGETAAASDLPGGLHAIDPGRLPGIVGLAIGTGHALAAWADRPTGCIAVLVNASHLLHQADDDPLLARVMVDHVLLHELAHALTATGDLITPIGPLLDQLQASDPPEPADDARRHDARWAAALVLLTSRATATQPHGHLLVAATRGGLRAYGHDADAISQLVGHLDDRRPIRELVSDRGPVAQRLQAAGLLDAPRPRLTASRRPTGAPAMPTSSRRSQASRIVMAILAERGPGPDGWGFMTTACSTPSPGQLVLMARLRHLVPHGITAADLPRIVALVEQHLPATPDPVPLETLRPYIRS
jgi:hypothetical protein